MAWRRVRPKKKTVPPEVVTDRPPRMKITPEEAIRRTEAFVAERKEQFIESVRNGKPARG